MRNQLFHNTGGGGSRRRAPTAGPAFARAGDRPRRRLRRHRQRRRRRHRRHEQQRAGAAAAQPGRRTAQPLAAGPPRPAPRQPVRVRRVDWRRARRAARRSGGACGPTAAICRRATCACTSASARHPPGHRGRRAVAGRPARTLDRRRGRPRDGAAAWDGQERGRGHQPMSEVIRYSAAACQTDMPDPVDRRRCGRTRTACWR